jgi:hypothetical protein
MNEKHIKQNWELSHVHLPRFYFHVDVGSLARFGDGGTKAGTLGGGETRALMIRSGSA